MNSIKWQRVPAVWTGGSLFFHTAETPIGRRWIIWDRRIKSFTVQDEKDMRVPVKSVAEGKRIVEEQINGRA
jgi:hypothetical protein